MSLLIKQGKHDTSKDGQFEIIIEKNVTAKISKLTINTKMSGALNVEFTLLNGANKGRKVLDTVGYDQSSPIAFKYRALRKAVGCPYDTKEPATIDVESLLLNKAVVLNLSERKYNDKNTGEEKTTQQITYVSTPAAPATGTQAPEADEDAETDEPNDDNLPFENGLSETEDSDDDPLKGW